MKLPRFTRRPVDRLEPQGWSNGDDSSIADLLGAYAGSISPDEATMSRVGASVRAAFVESTTARRAGIAVGLDAQGEAGGRGRAWSWSRRRAFAAICAVAIVTLSTVGLAAAESGPGQPFYRLRLGIESVNLPPAGSQDRLAVDLSRADARLDDIATQAAASNWNGAADAANAYADVIATIALPSDMSSKGGALDRLDGQLARLEQLRTTSNGPETVALDRAIAALSAILGIPIPTPAPALTPNSGARVSEDGAAASPGAHSTASGDRDPRGSDRPNPTRTPDRPGTSGGDNDNFGPGGPSSGHTSPTPTPTPTPTRTPSGSDGGRSGSSDQPRFGH
jgi:hypothetical protein